MDVDRAACCISGGTGEPAFRITSAISMAFQASSPPVVKICCLSMDPSHFKVLYSLIKKQKTCVQVILKPTASTASTCCFATSPKEKEFHTK